MGLIISMSSKIYITRLLAQEAINVIEKMSPLLDSVALSVFLSIENSSLDYIMIVLINVLYITLCQTFRKLF